MSKAEPRVALITGASSGFGAEFSRQLARQCDKLLLTGRQREPLEALADELRREGIGARVVVADLSTTIGIAQLVETIRQQGPLDYLINNAGFATLGPYAEQQPASQDAMVSLHINATMALTLAALGGMRSRQRGCIVNVSSLAALAPAADIAVYSGTKSFINAFSVSLQQEVQAQGINIQCLCPGLTHTGFHSSRHTTDFDTASIPEKFWMNAETVVSASLAALKQSDAPVIMVPGAINRRSAEAALRRQLDLGFGDSPD